MDIGILDNAAAMVGNIWNEKYANMEQQRVPAKERLQINIYSILLLVDLQLLNDDLLLMM